MKKRIALLLAVLMVLSMAACSAQGDKNQTEPVETEPVDLGYFFDTPSESQQDITQFSYVKASQMDPLYVRDASSRFIMISALAPQFAIGGATHPSENMGRYYRLDYANKDAYSQENRTLAANTSGISIRFCTNADEICIKVGIYNAPNVSAHQNAKGVYGIDVYVGTGTKRAYCGASAQHMTSDTQIEETVALPGGYQEVQINLPLYAGARDIEIGFPGDALIAAPTARSYGDIVFYGSSITQGCSASRPGLAYTNILCMALNANCRNLGFSGSALGQQVIAEYIASLKNVAAFVMDYDHNNTTDGLRATHYDFYKTVRDAHPDIPIILVSRPVYLKEPTGDQRERIAIIQATYDKAVAEGDTNIYFVSGYDFFPKDYPDLFMVDTVHPNDLGMYYMAKTIYPVLKEALDKPQE